LKTPRPIGAIVLAAGLGKRMNSGLPKVLHQLGGRPLISYPLRILYELGADPIVVVVGHGADQVRRACGDNRVRFAHQREQKGTGDAALAARDALRGFRGDLLLVNGDLPLLRAASFGDLIERHRRVGAAVSLLTAEVDKPHGFGRIERDAGGDVVRIIEERDASDAQRRIREINVGLYCADADYLFDALNRLAPANEQSELYLTDIVEMAGAARKAIATASAAPIEGRQISSRADLAEVEAMVRDEINRKWMDAGVTFEDPATAYIGPDVTIGRDTVIGANVTLRGKTSIGRRCRLDGTDFLSDATLGDDVHIKFGVVITASIVEDEVEIGPFAQLRPETHLKRGVHIGDFVETKKAVIGARTKANHLAYLGDADIGEDSNIGAGTITCNYDGFSKYRTKIGDRVQVGSDSQLVAPVSIGDDAYIATGSTVRNDVASGVLFFNPRGEKQRKGWVAARRQKEKEKAPAAKSTGSQPRTRKAPKGTRRKTSR
jgi:bifunctional UDP-N-acetylglucosamine pyrophosphorylase/glucosamine-1-phosphate N-acetyltransferase